MWTLYWAVPWNKWMSSCRRRTALMWRVVRECMNWSLGTCWLHCKKTHYVPPLVMQSAVPHFLLRTKSSLEQRFLLLKRCATESERGAYISLDVVQRAVTVLVQVDKVIVLLQAFPVKFIEVPSWWCATVLCLNLEVVRCCCSNEIK